MGSTRQRRGVSGMIATLAVGALAAGCGGGGASQDTAASGSKDGGKKKVFVAMSYSGNAWQDEASNLALSIAKTPPYDQKVDVRREISGTEVQAQISQYQSMIADGADAIVSFPVSPTGLNRVIKEGCAKGVTFVMYDATVTEPCAYNVSYITATPSQEDQGKGAPATATMGYDGMVHLAEQLGGKGKIFIARGVPGNSVDATHYAGIQGALKKYPGIDVVAEYVGMWDSSTQQKETRKALAAHPDVDGIWAGYGEAGTIKALKSAGKKIPISGETSNYFRQELRKGWPGVSTGSPPAQGGIAMKVAMYILENGKEGVPKDIEVPLPWVTADLVKVCEGEQYTAGCNVFPPDKVPDEATAQIFQPELLPESSLTAAQSGKPLAGQKIEELPDLKEYAQPPERRFITRGYCDDGWKEATLPEGLKGCAQG
jgi:ribose transport system substrate-binding protein